MTYPLRLAVLVGVVAGLVPAAQAEDPAEVFHELKVYSAAGTPWRVAQEDWAGARQRVDRDPRWSAWLLREAAEGRPLDGDRARPRGLGLRLVP